MLKSRKQRQKYEKERGCPRSISARLGELKIARRGLTCAPVRLDLEGDLLAFDEAAQTGPFERADMDEYVLAAVIGLNEAIAFLTIIPFYDAHIHGGSPFASDAQSRISQDAAIFELWREVGTCAIAKGEAETAQSSGQIDGIT